jgi:hypothetical protein
MGRNREGGVTSARAGRLSFALTVGVTDPRLPRVIAPATRPTVRFLVLALLAVRVVLACIALAHPERAFFGNDPLVHATIARNLVENGVFSDHEIPPFVANINRTPLYPFLVAATYALSGEQYVRVMIVFQNVVAVATAFGFAAFLNGRAGPRAATACLLLLLADVPNILVSNLLLTEVPYTALAGLSFVLFLRTVEGRNGGGTYAALAGVTGALAALCRPIHLFLPFVLAALGVALAREKRRFLGPCALFLAAFAAGITPWLLRNHRDHGKAQLTHLSAVHFYLFKAGGALAEAEGRDFDEVKEELERNARDHGIANIHENPREDLLLDEGRRLIREHPLGFVRSTFKGAVILATFPDKGKLSWLLGQPAAEFRVAFAGREGAAHAWDRIRRTVQALGGLELASILFQLLVLAVTYGLVAWGFSEGTLRRFDPLVVLAACCVVYYIVLPAGPEVQGRFRVPLWPYLVVLASLACAESGGSERRGPLAKVKDDLSRYLRLAESEEVVITRHGGRRGLVAGGALLLIAMAAVSRVGAVEVLGDAPSQPGGPAFQQVSVTSNRSGADYDRSRGGVHDPLGHRRVIGPSVLPKPSSGTGTPDLPCARDAGRIRIRPEERVPAGRSLGRRSGERLQAGANHRRGRCVARADLLQAKGLGRRYVGRRVAVRRTAPLRGITPASDLSLRVPRGPGSEESGARCEATTGCTRGRLLRLPSEAGIGSVAWGREPRTNDVHARRCFPSIVE